MAITSNWSVDEMTRTESVRGRNPRLLVLRIERQ